MRQARLIVGTLLELGHHEAATAVEDQLRQLNRASLIPIDEYGFVELIDYMGDDLTVVNAARVSHNKEHSEFDASDDKLIKFLADHKHWTPFGQPTIQLRFKMPLFVAAQFKRSTVGIVYNEVSRRYVSHRPQFYQPSVWRQRPAGNIKQGSGNALTENQAAEASFLMNKHVEACLSLYEKLLAMNIAPEQARMVLPQNMYTEFVASMTLAAALRVVQLRVDPHAQKEIQDYAQAILKIIRVLFGRSVEAHIPQ